MDEQQCPPSSPEDARRLAETAVDWARLYGGFRLDFSPTSLQQLDALLDGFYITGGLQAQGLLPAHDEEAAVVAAWANLAGCYVGEVILRNLGGRWRPAAETTYAKLPGASAFPLVVELPNGHFCHPLARPFKVLECGRDGESLEGFYAGVAALVREPGA